MEITLKQLKSLLKTLEKASVTEFEYQDDKYRLRLSVGGASGIAALAASTSALPELQGEPGAGASAARREAADTAYVTSPFVGTFYRSATPESEPFIEIGASVRKGQTLCIVEAMKLMNEIETEFPGTILEILVENGASVEFGQKLFKLKKA